MYINELEKIISKERIYVNELMSKHTSFKIGGPAECLVKIQTLQELKVILELVKKENIPVTVIGNGSNILVSDDGIKGIVLKIEINTFELNTQTAHLRVGSGVKLGFIAQKCLKNEIAGFEFASGIPGTIGGAIRMNAGAYGSEMKDIVVKTRYMTYDGKIKTMTLDEHEFEYRNSVFSKLDVIIIDTTIRVKKGEKSKIEEKINEYATARRNAQPLEYPNAGSTFKRGEGYITAKLIDECGLKGYSIGDAEISTKHAGFIVNKGKATASDVLTLVEHIKKEIKTKYDLDIELEILVLGDEK